jgi:hypothetical protein
MMMKEEKTGSELYIKKVKTMFKLNHALYLLTSHPTMSTEYPLTLSS